MSAFRCSDDAAPPSPPGTRIGRVAMTTPARSLVVLPYRLAEEVLERACAAIEGFRLHVDGPREAHQG
jgi:hypothetical protein